MSVEVFERVASNRDVLVGYLGEALDSRDKHIEGGDHHGRRVLYGERGELASMVDTYIGRDVRENGGESWRGMIY